MRDYTTPITRIDSLPEMAAAMDQELARVRARHGFKEGPRTIFPQHLAHYILAHYFSRPAAERDAIVVEGRRIMEERRRSPRPIYWDVDSAAGESAAAPAAGKAAHNYDPATGEPTRAAGRATKPKGKTA